MKEKLIKYSYYLMIIIMIVIATYVLINWLIPLFFSCLIVLVLQPLLAKEIKLLKIKNIFLSKCLIVFNYLLFIGVIIAMIIFAVIQIYTVLELLPNYLENLYQLFSQNHYIIDATKYLDVIYSGSMSIVESISTGFITGLIAFIMKIPSILFDLIFVVITSLFILLDYSRIERAIFDFMPVLGLDMIMIPWIIISALTNKIYLAGALLVIYMIIVITKNILEPKLIAKNLGVTPVLSLVGMYLGMKVMGVIGLIIVPTLLMVIIQILKVKYQLKNKVEIQKS